MTLTPQQLEYIRSFISKRGFTALDLQMEIIDHVACRTEELLTQQPTLCFEEAVTRTHHEFGIFGFSTLEDAMQKSLSRKYRNQFVLELKLWLSFPTVILVIGFTFLVYQLFFLVPLYWLVGTISFIYLAAAVGILVRHFKLHHRYRKMMVIQVTNGVVAGLLSVLLQVGLRLPQISQSTLPLWLQASLLTGFSLLFAFALAAFFRLTRFAIQECWDFEQRYPSIFAS